jgi:hypothetical protein
MQSQQRAGRLIEVSKVHGIWIIPGPVIQKRILAVVYMVFVSPSYCIKPAMASFWYSVNAGNGNIWGQNGIDVVNKFMIQYAINRKMKEIPVGMHPGIGSGRACQLNIFSQVSGHRSFYLPLDGDGIVLYLKTRKACPLVS